MGKDSKGQKGEGKSACVKSSGEAGEGRGGGEEGGSKKHAVPCTVGGEVADFLVDTASRSSCEPKDVRVVSIEAYRW